MEEIPFPPSFVKPQRPIRNIQARQKKGHASIIWTPRYLTVRPFRVEKKYIVRWRLPSMFDKLLDSETILHFI